MDNQEAIEVIKLALSQVEWDYPMDYATAFDMAISALQAQNVPDTNVGSMISRQAAIDALMEQFKRNTTIAIRAKLTVEGLPSAQPQIIRCKDCKHKGTKNCMANAWTTIFGVMVKDDFYCGLAERRTDDER